MDVMDVMEYVTGYFMNILWIFMEQIMEYIGSYRRHPEAEEMDWMTCFASISLENLELMGSENWQLWCIDDFLICIEMMAEDG